MVVVGLCGAMFSSFTDPCGGVGRLFCCPSPWSREGLWVGNPGVFGGIGVLWCLLTMFPPVVVGIGVRRGVVCGSSSTGGGR